MGEYLLEVETKIIGFDEGAIGVAVRKGYLKFVGKVLFKRWIFNISKSKDHDEFVRVRTDGKNTTLTYKYRSYSKGKGLRNTHEIEVSVSNCSNMVDILSRLFKEPLYQENVRKTFMHNNVEVTVNYWPKIPPVMEIEGETEAEVEKVFTELNCGGIMIGNISYDRVYKHYGIDLNKIQELKLDTMHVQR